MKTKTTLPPFKKWKFFLLSIPFMLCSHASMAQTQVGSDIVGEAAGDNSGRSVSMPDAYTVAIGANYNDGNGTESGHVRVYRWSGNSWVQKGADIDREATYNSSGWSVNMPDSNTVAIGAPFNSGNGSGAGHVRVYRCRNAFGSSSGKYRAYRQV